MYATRDDIIKLYGMEFLLAVLPSDMEEEAEQNASIENALLNAGHEIDGHLSARYDVPLPGKPAVLLRPAIDIAIYILAHSAAQSTEAIEKRYDDHLKFLKLVAKGDAGLGADEPKIETGNAGSASGAEFTANDRLFGRGR